MLASGRVQAGGIKVCRSFSASCACELIGIAGVVLTDWIMTTVARIESSSDSKCFRWSATASVRAAGRGVGRPTGLVCGRRGSMWPKGVLLECAARVAAEASGCCGPVGRPRLTTRSVCGDFVRMFAAASSDTSELVESGERGRT